MRSLSLAVALILAAMPLASSSAELSVCRAASGAGAPPGTYPDHPLSPYESLRNFDTVFLGEVLVPARKCSLGYCAGIKVLDTVKGTPERTALVQIAAPSDGPCGPTTFLAKGARWVVFANQGTTRSGLRFLKAGDDGPSFTAQALPDFDKLEGRYRTIRAQLDQAINERLR